MRTFFTKLVMLLMFILCVISGWAAVYMTFQVTLWNIILGILAAFFLLRALELADKLNNYGQYSKPEEEKPGKDTTPEEE